MGFRIGFFLAALIALVPAQLSAQGIFEAFGFPKTVVSTGQTEVLGSVHIGLRQGPTGADTLVIDVSPLRITNTAAADLRFSIAGNITLGAATIEAAEGRVLIPVNAGGTSGSVRIDGIRAAIAGSGVSSVNAKLSWREARNVLASATSVPVVDRVATGLSVDTLTDRFTIVNGNVVDSSAAFPVTEGYASAFTSNEPGQSVATQVRIRVSDFPSGLEMTFPATVTSADSAATLTTIEGTAVTLPRASGNKEVVYQFSGAANSDTIVESFSMPFTVSVSGRVEILQPTIDVSLFPIGLAVPTDALPSTAVRRFSEENHVALEGSSRIVTKTLFYTGVDASRDNSLFLFNPGPNVSNVTLSAYDASGRLLSGSNITNNVSVSLAANRGYEQTLATIFGSGATAIATVRAQSTREGVLGQINVSASGLAESAALVSRGIAHFVLPSMGGTGRVNILNPNGAKVTGIVRLVSPEGASVANAMMTIDPMASSSKTLSELFGTDREGQVVGDFDNGVIAYESFGTAELNLVAAQPAAGVPALYIPFFATGNGYETDLSLINTANETVTLSARIYNAQGGAVGSAKSITLVAGQQLQTTIQQLFQVQGFMSGYARIDVPEMNRGPWRYFPTVNGVVRLRTARAATTLAVSGYPLQDSFVLASGFPSGQFQGLAIVNPSAAEVTVNLQAISSTGAVTQSATLTLQPGQVSSKLTSELFTGAIEEKSTIRVSASAPVVVTSITGTNNGDLLKSAIGQR